MTIAEFETFFRNDIAANLALVKAAKIPVQWRSALPAIVSAARSPIVALISPPT